jgi:glutathione S-transferase
MLTLYSVSGAWGMSSISPFCTKLETWLRMAGIAFEARASGPRGPPKGKLPFVVLEDGRPLGDSQHILEHLTARHGVMLDAGLTPSQQATGRALRRMLEEATYFCLVYERWDSAEGWALYRHAFRALLPPVLREVLPGVIRRGMRKALHAQGTGRHSATEVHAMGLADMRAVAHELGDKPFLFGDQPSSVDATAFAFVDGFLGFPIRSPAHDFVEGHPGLRAYHARIRERWYPQGPALPQLQW